MASRITSLQLYSVSHQYTRINGTPVSPHSPPHSQQTLIGLLLPPSSLSTLTQLAMWSIGGAAVILSPLLSAHQIQLQIERFALTSLVTSSSFASKLIDMMKNDPTVMTTLSAFVLVSSCLGLSF